VDKVVAMAEAVRQEHVTLDGYRVHLHRFDPPLGVADDAEVSPEMLGGTTVLGTKLLLRRESHKARRLMELEEMLGTLKTNALEIMSTIRQTRHELESLRARARLPGWRDVPKEVLMASFQQASYYVRASSPASISLDGVLVVRKFILGIAIVGSGASARRQSTACVQHSRAGGARCGRHVARGKLAC
jgi:hypothetical protein